MPSTFWAREDSGSANNPAINLTVADAVEITFVPSGASGDLILEQPAPNVIDPDTQVEIDGTAYNFVFELSGTLPTENSNGAQQVPEQFEGDPVYIITVIDYPDIGETTRFVFLPDQFATQAEMDSFGNGAIDVQNVDETPDPGPVCFARGTLILTLSGSVPVEELDAGDRVMTLDNGAKPIVWISKSEHIWPGSLVRHKPVEIAANSIEPGKPKRDLCVSPQHAVMISVDSPVGKCGNADVLAPAKGLTDLPGVRTMKGKRNVTYYHILLENHEIVISEGLETESFFPGPTALSMLTYKQRREIYSLLPDLIEDPENGYGRRNRPCLTVAQTRALISKTRQKDNDARLLPQNTVFDEVV